MSTDILRAAALAGADALARALSTRWPDVKFAIDFDAWEAGSDIQVTWSGGPDVASVRAIAAPFEFPHYHGPADLYATNIESGIGAKFVTLTRLDGEVRA